MPEVQPRLITYCTNIHPGETWAEVFDALRRHLPTIKAAVSPHRPFPVGLRLGARAARMLSDFESARFAAWLGEHDLFVPTLNGFPFGDFHSERVKGDVYLPDWRSPARVQYTTRLADLLARWLPAGMTGSISTVPLGHKIAIGAADAACVRANLTAALAHLAAIADEHGKHIMLALEPEPGCALETTAEVCRFFDDLALPAALRLHLGICYDCCHQAVQFEGPRESLAALAAAAVPIAKVQISSAPRLQGAHADELASLAEPRYLHQVAVRQPDGVVCRYPDLPIALATHPRASRDEWRCHVHLPIFHTGYGGIETTREFITQLLPLAPAAALLEVETYTWDVLPEHLRLAGVGESIIRELTWLQGELSCIAPSSSMS